MRMALAGDQAAYRMLLVAITPHLRTIARHALQRAGGSPSDIEDVVQDTLLAVHLKRGTWDTTMPLTPWLNAVARHKAIDTLRRKGGRVEFDLDSVADDVVAAPAGGDTSIDVQTALSGLDQRQRTIVELMSLEGRSASEVGAKLDMTEGAVRVALHRALKSMAAKLSGSKP
jgi:RNA polymerase sigma-70 factor (ECF subfamily)